MCSYIQETTWEFHVMCHVFHPSSKQYLLEAGKCHEKYQSITKTQRITIITTTKNCVTED